MNYGDEDWFPEEVSSGEEDDDSFITAFEKLGEEEDGPLSDPNAMKTGVKETWKAKAMRSFILLVLLLAGLLENGVEFLERSIVAKDSAQALVDQSIGSSLLTLFENIFEFVNSGVLNLVAIHMSAILLSEGGNPRKIGKLFQLGILLSIIAGSVCGGLAVLVGKPYVDTFGQHDQADAVFKFLWIRAPSIPFDFMASVITGTLIGTLSFFTLLAAAGFGALLHVGLLFLILPHFESPLYGVGAVRTITLAVTALFGLFLMAIQRSFRETFGCFKICSRLPPGQIKDVMNAYTSSSFFLFVKSFVETAGGFLLTLLSIRISVDTFVASQATAQYTTFYLALGGFVTVIMNMYGSRFAKVGDGANFKSLIWKTLRMLIAPVIIMAAVTYFTHAFRGAVESVTGDSSEREVITHLVHPVWFVVVPLPLLTWLSQLYQTMLVAWEKYNLLAYISIGLQVGVVLPVSLVSYLHFKSLFGLMLAQTLYPLCTLIVLVPLVHTRLPEWEGKVQAAMRSIDGNVTAMLINH